MDNLLSAVGGIILGVILEDPLTKLKDILIHFFKKLFYKTKKVKVKNGELFSLGKIESTWLIADGDGQESYTPKTITTYFNSSELVLPNDLKELKKDVEKNEKNKKAKGQSFSFNGDRYRLEKITIGRERSEDLELQLWFGPSDYYTFLATNMNLDKKEIYEKYVQTNWEQPVKYFSNSFGINLCIITEDEYIILTKRSSDVGSYADFYNVSLSEGISRTFDRGINTQAPDIYRAAIRGVVEELGINSVEGNDIKLLSLGVDTKYSQWGMLGMLRVDKKIEEILDLRSRGVKDKWEASELVYIKFEISDVLKFIKDHPNFAPAALTCIYQTLVHEFGREKIDKAVTKYLR